jgi:glycerophosphoryl diester phosphodiesterase
MAIYLTSRSKNVPSDPLLLPARTPVVIAHRGGRGLWPENTIFAFRRAVEMGVDALELDVRGSADGELVVLHDERVDRTTNGKGRVQDLSWAELKSLDAGHHWTADAGGTYPYRQRNIRIPRLQEVLQEFSGVPMSIEIKQESPPILAPFCAALRSAGLGPRVLVSSFKSDLVKAFRAACPEMATSATAGEATLFWALEQVFSSRLYSPPCGSFQVPEQTGKFRVVDRGFVAAAHAQGLSVHVWTVNDLAAMQRLVALGVDGIITDYPDRLSRSLRRLELNE